MGTLEANHQLPAFASMQWRHGANLDVARQGRVPRKRNLGRHDCPRSQHAFDRKGETLATIHRLRQFVDDANDSNIATFPSRRQLIAESHFGSPRGIEESRPARQNGEGAHRDDLRRGAPPTCEPAGAPGCNERDCARYHKVCCGLERRQHSLLLESDDPVGEGKQHATHRTLRSGPRPARRGSSSRQ